MLEGRGNGVVEAVRGMWRGLRPANRSWLCATTGLGVVFVVLYLLAGTRVERAAGTPLGLTFGGLAFTLMLAATAYRTRKRWRPLVAQR